MNNAKAKAYESRKQKDFTETLRNAVIYGTREHVPQGPPPGCAPKE
jgi:hypothetical protein